ncbi:MAG: O-antigen ligase family protein [Xanthobacteraceae bacterium]
MSALADAGTRYELRETQRQALADRFLHVTLYVTILSSFFVVVEPAPYEYLAAVLGFACILARVTLPRVVLPLLILLLIRDAGGAIGLLKILDTGWMRLQGDPSPIVEDFQYPDSIRFLATSFYLGLTGVMIACIVSQDTMRRIATLRSAYIMGAVIASVLGTLGYFSHTFGFLPALDYFAPDGRAAGGFKGPNDLGAFLIPVLLWLIQGFVVDKIRLHNLVAIMIIFVGLLLTFSRGAWGSGLFSAAMLIYLLFVSQSDRRLRNRIVLFVAIGVVVAIAIFLLLSSIGTIGHMFAERSQLQSYDINADNRSRLMLEEDSLREIFNHPLGMGPWGFAHATDWVSHDVYLGTMLNHGWIGGAAYLTLVVVTLYVGFRALWLRTPWQTFLIATYPSFVAMMLEGVWGDTDHWRHFYVVLGLVWGMVAATHRAVWMAHRAQPTDRNSLLSAGVPTFRQIVEKPS